MVDYDTNVRNSEIIKRINEVKESMDQILQSVKPEQDLWDNSEVIRRWKISVRTLATWRSKGLISFVQVNGKIWYPKEARESFLKNHLIKVQQNVGGVNHE